VSFGDTLRAFASFLLAMAAMSMEDAVAIDAAVTR
jgi:hypothetical protein